MTDGELDEMLNRWKTPEAPRGMRERARAGFAAQFRGASAKRRFSAGLLGSLWPRVFATAALGLGAVALIATKAVPQTPNLKGIPFTVESELTQFENDGSVSSSLFLLSSMRDGSEVLLSKWKSNPLTTLVSHLADAVHGTIPPHVAQSQRAGGAKAGALVITGCFDHGTCMLTASYVFASAAELMRSGCSAEGTVAGNENILGYKTVEVRIPMSDTWRVVLWRAPALGCFALQAHSEAKEAGGSYRLFSEKKARQVTLLQ